MQEILIKFSIITKSTGIYSSLLIPETPLKKIVTIAETGPKFLWIVVFWNILNYFYNYFLILWEPNIALQRILGESTVIFYHNFLFNLKLY